MYYCLLPLKGQTIQHPGSPDHRYDNFERQHEENVPSDMWAQNKHPSSYMSAQCDLPVAVAQLDAHPMVASLIPTRSSNVLSWRLIMKYFCGHALPSADSRFLAKECAQVLGNRFSAQEKCG